MHEGRKAGAPFDIPNWANDWLTSQSYDGKGFTNNAVRHTPVLTIFKMA